MINHVKAISAKSLTFEVFTGKLGKVKIKKKWILQEE